jgi:beta-glucanase (GH16 family)
VGSVRLWLPLVILGSVGCGSDGAEAGAPQSDAAMSEGVGIDGEPASHLADTSLVAEGAVSDDGETPAIIVDAYRGPDTGSSEAGVIDVQPTGNVAPPPGFVWQLIPELSDEFEGATLDDAKWSPSHPYWQGRPPSQFDSSNVFVKDGKLGLVSTTSVDSLSMVGNPDQDIWVKAACVASKRSVASYGYYEARIKASALSMTSSFWFQGAYSEIDVVEELGRPVINPGDSQLMQMNTHYFAGGWANDKATPKQWSMPTGAADAYHTYAMWWRDKNAVWFFHDGQKVAEVVPGGDFAETMYLFFDTEVFTWYGLPTVASLKDASLDTMLVDWVRAWKLAPVAAQ